MSIEYGSVAAFLSVMIALVGLLLETRKSRLAMQSDILLRIDERFCCSETRTLRQKAARKLLKRETPNYELTEVLDFFTLIAYMVEHGALSPRLAYAPYEYWICRYWHSAKEHITETRRFEPESWVTLERLVQKLERIGMEKGRQAYTDEELARFLREEEALS